MSREGRRRAGGGGRETGHFQTLATVLCPRDLARNAVHGEQALRLGVLGCHAIREVVPAVPARFCHFRVTILRNYGAELAPR